MAGIRSKLCQHLNVRWLWVCAGCRQHRVDLTPVVSLMVEELNSTEGFWLLDPSGTIPGIPDKHSLQVGISQTLGPLFDFLVPLQTERLEIIPIRWAREGVLDGFLWALVPL